MTAMDEYDSCKAKYCLSQSPHPLHGNTQNHNTAEELARTYVNSARLKGRNGLEAVLLWQTLAATAQIVVALVTASNSNICHDLKYTCIH